MHTLTGAEAIDIIAGVKKIFFGAAGLQFATATAVRDTLDISLTAAVSPKVEADAVINGRYIRPTGCTEDANMATVNADMSVNVAVNSMVLYERIKTSTMARLLSSLLINCAKEAAAGVAISSKMISHIHVLDQGEGIAEIELTRTLIIQQAGTATFCWQNHAQRSVFSLLKWPIVNLIVLPLMQSVKHSLKELSQ